MTQVLRDRFGHDKFRENQRAIINGTLDGRDVMGLIPTGGGKSLTFYIPAIIGKGVSIIIMPLIALIHDNVKFCERMDISYCEVKPCGKYTAYYTEED